MSSALSYRRDIDGLRAIAVGGVVAYHLAPETTPGGFLGVDVFFVISGFLITAILWADARRDGAISYWRFYARRARRILPALLALVVGVLAMGLFLAPPRALADLALSSVAALGFAANFHFKDQTGYFDPPAEAQPMLHTWSLAVEEQFYLIWPLLLALVLRLAWARARPERGAALLALLVLASLTLAEIQARIAPVEAFYLLPARLWELGLGGVLALAAPAIASRLSALGREAAAGAGVALLAFALFGQSDAMLFPGLSALPACLGAALVILSGLPGEDGAPVEPSVSGLLRTAPFVGIGLISYSLYLWHWPLIAFYTLYEGAPEGWGARVGLLAAGLVLAWLSWRFVERPFRRPLASEKRTVGVGLGALAAVALAALGLHLSGGWASRAPASLAAFEEAGNPPRPALDCGAHPLGDACAFGAPKRGESYDLLLLGDSHGYNVTPAAIAYAERHGLSGLRLVRPLCLPLEGYVFRRKGVEGVCAGFRAAVDQILRENAGAKVVWLVGRWSNHTFEPTLTGGAPEDPAAAEIVLRDGESGAPNRADARRVLAGAMERMVERLLDETQAEILLMQQTPDFAREPLDCGLIALWRGRSPEAACATARVRWDARRAFSVDLLDRLAAASDRVRTLDPTDVFCGPLDCRTAQGETPLYYDKTHLSAIGARVLTERLAIPAPR